METKLTLRFLTEPTHANYSGKVHGGMLMKWLDQAGYACATNYSNLYCVLAYVSGINLIKSIGIGDLLEIRAQVVFTGNTSVSVAIEVFGKKLSADEFELKAQSLMTFVGMNAEGKPGKMPYFEPKTEKELQLAEMAKQSRKSKILF